MNTFTSDITNNKFQKAIRFAEKYLAAKDIGSAIMKYEQALEIYPRDVPALLTLARLYIEQGHHNKPSELTIIASKEPIPSPHIAIELISLLVLLGNVHIANEVLTQLPPDKWDSAESLSEVALYLTMGNSIELARIYARAGVEREPNNPTSWYRYAVTEHFYGNLKVTSEYTEKYLSVIPDHPAAHWLISTLKLPNEENRIKRIEQCLKNAANKDSESRLNFALHNELHNSGQYELAWTALDNACKAMRQINNYSSEENAKLFESLNKWSADEVAINDGYVDPELTPIFVVGLHRSGTTLTERFLSGHSQVTAGGETYGVTNQIRSAVDLHFNGETNIQAIEDRANYDYCSFGKNYIDGIRWCAKDKPFITDKLPSNFLNLGFIARALPNAKIILVRRDPIAIGFSSLRTLFINTCEYSYDQIEFAEYYKQFDNLMTHWKDILGPRILEIKYEELVSNTDVHIEKMASFCGLELEQSMAEISSRKAPSSTASSVMMRDGVRRDRGNVWSNYESQLQPMINHLNK